MRRSIATVSLSGGLQEKLYAAAAAKFDAVEIFEEDITYFEGAPADVRELAGELGLGFSVFQPFFDFEAVPDAQFQRSLDRAERKFDLMGELGVDTMLVSSNSSAAAIPDEARMAAQLAALADRAQARGLRLGYEAVAWGAHVRTLADAWRIVLKADHPALGVILDSFHGLASGGSLADVALGPAEKMFLLQLSDAPQLEVDVTTLGRHFRCWPGQGTLDIAGFAAAALEAGYDGPVSLEVFNDDLRAAPARQAAQEGMRSLLFVEEQLSRRPAGLPSRVAAGLASPPPPPELFGIGFIEFAVDATAATELGQWLTGLGFALAGRHRSKDVRLYRAGQAYVALNAGLDSFAHAYFHLHGPSVCSVGLKVADRAALLARAEAYGFKQHQERLGPDEYRMPAIRAPDGSLIHVLDADYDPMPDFVAEPAGEAAAFLGVDHLGRAVPHAQFDSWLLYYRILLGLEPQDPWLLADPHGVVHSRSLTDGKRAVRLPLAFSDSRRTALARSLSTFAGSGVNQVAFATADIFAAVEAMQARGARLLPIPANYYAELQADLGLDDALVERLRRSQVLYDRDDAGGEFFHAYSEIFHDRFFFEVVQRSGGYDAYGARNAPVRMAAQTRVRARAANP